MLTEEKIAAIKERCQKATPPPWRGTYTEWNLQDDYGGNPYQECVLLFTHGMVDPERPVGGTSDSTLAYFIADFPRYVPFLIQVLEGLLQTPRVTPTIKDLERVHSIRNAEARVPWGPWRFYPAERTDTMVQVISLAGQTVCWLYPSHYSDPEARQWNVDAEFIAHASRDIVNLTGNILYLTRDIKIPKPMIIW